jgi:hypothetical protein
MQMFDDEKYLLAFEYGTWQYEKTLACRDLCLSASCQMVTLIKGLCKEI